MPSADDWEKLSIQQKAKVRNIACNSWEDIKVYIQYFDTRDGAKFKLPYSTLLIVFKMNGKEYKATISSQVNGREK